MEIRQIGIIEYVTDAGDLRSALSDYYLKLDQGKVLMIGAFDDSADMIAMLQAYDGDDVCAIRNAVCADDRAEALLPKLISEILRICRSDIAEWVVGSGTETATMLEHMGWELTAERYVFTIYPHDKVIANLAKPVIMAHKKTMNAMSKKGIEIVSLADNAGDVRSDILAVTEEAKIPYVESLFDGAKGLIDRTNSFVLLRNGEIISYILNTMRNNSNLENVYIYTPVDKRGNGYAGFLTRHMVGVMCASDYDAIRFFVDESNIPSIRMVRKYLGRFIGTEKEFVYTYRK